ncbi:hypothetical protein AK812_SmicGene5497 [Symbiodinium microadriaticum]|uniref:Uncharacterized protein n=1 Tax=Symbiodinium microadriaticum TaxID=2951 RepID=A0A1Q9ETM6_SYMMI|nr:hypothetical protein AK812_SmicGene5497 [Symbiodinium microadriaticum]
MKDLHLLLGVSQLIDELIVEYSWLTEDIQHGEPRRLGLLLLKLSVMYSSKIWISSDLGSLVHDLLPLSSFADIAPPSWTDVSHLPLSLGWPMTVAWATMSSVPNSLSFLDDDLKMTLKPPLLSLNPLKWSTGRRQ